MKFHEDLPLLNVVGGINEKDFKIFLSRCSKANVSDITIQGGDYIWLEYHGNLYQGSKQIVQQGIMVTFLAVIWGSEIESILRGGEPTDRALSISGSEYEVERGKKIRFRCNFIQAHVDQVEKSFSITMRIIPTDLPKLENMYLPKNLENELFPGSGLVIVGGPTGSGKTTLLAAIFREICIKFSHRKVITYEDPIEYILGGSHCTGIQPSQSELGRDFQSFPDAIKSALRRKPSVISIGELRDLETIDIAIESAFTGHLTYATGHVSSCAEAINRFIQSYPPAQQSSMASRLLGSLAIVLVQRLLKTTDGKRIAIREYFIFNNNVKKEMSKIHFDTWSQYITEKLADNNLITIGFDLVKKGIVSKEEFIEVFGYYEYAKLSGEKE